jgi:hypothetical protein
MFDLVVIAVICCALVTLVQFGEFVLGVGHTISG